jgi:spermidine synthase
MTGPGARQLRRWMALIAPLLIAAPAAADVIHVERSLYRNIQVTDDGQQICMGFRSRGFNAIQSCTSKTDRDRLVVDYTRLLMTAVLANPSPRRIFVAGLGGGSVPRVLRQLYPQAHLDIAEIDPAVVGVAERFFDFRPSASVRIVEVDARVHLKRAGTSGRYDLIILDAFKGDGHIPEHLLTLEFLREAQTAMVEGGILASNTHASSRLYDAESRTYAQAFGGFLNFKEGSNRVIVARKGGPPAAAELAGNARPLQPRLTRYGVDAAALLNRLVATPDWDPKVRPLTDQHAPASLLQGPPR